jgi:hypothetical protein
VFLNVDYCKNNGFPGVCAGFNASSILAQNSASLHIINTLSALLGVRHDHPNRRAWCFHQAHTAE